MVSNVADIVKAIRESSGIMVRVESATGYPIFFTVEKERAIMLLETFDKPFDWCIDGNGLVLLG